MLILKMLMDRLNEDEKNDLSSGFSPLDVLIII